MESDYNIMMEPSLTELPQYVNIVQCGSAIACRKGWHMTFAQKIVMDLWIGELSDAAKTYIEYVDHTVFTMEEAFDIIRMLYLREYPDSCGASIIQSINLSEI